MASAGDVNGDGFGDVVVGALGFTGPAINAGQVFVFTGSGTGIANGTVDDAHASIVSDQASSGLGVSVASAGDVDGDGLGDVAAAAVGYVTSESNTGAAFVLPGSKAGGVARVDLDGLPRLESSATTLPFVAQVAGAGDVNGDGFADLVVGARGYDAGESGEGAAFVLLGGGQASRLSRPRQLRGDGSGTPVATWGSSGVAGTFEVELNVTSPRGREFAKVEVEACASGTAFGDARCSSSRSSIGPIWAASPRAYRSERPPAGSSPGACTPGEPVRCSPRARRLLKERARSCGPGRGGPTPGRPVRRSAPRSRARV